jgi:hypothetical protein
MEDMVGGFYWGAEDLLVRVVVVAFGLAGCIEVITGGKGGGDVVRGVAGVAAGVGTAVLPGEEGDRGGKGEREEGNRYESKKLGGRMCVSLA